MASLHLDPSATHLAGPENAPRTRTEFRNVLAPCLMLKLNDQSRRRLLLCTHLVITCLRWRTDACHVCARGGYFPGL